LGRHLAGGARAGPDRRAGAPLAEVPGRGAPASARATYLFRSGGQARYFRGHGEKVPLPGVGPVPGPFARAARFCRAGGGPVMPARPSEVMQQAADWVVRLRSPERLPVPAGVGQPDCAERFADWLRASPQHVREYLRAVEIWEGLSHPNAGGGRSREQLIAAAGDSNLVELPTREAVSGNN